MMSIIEKKILISTLQNIEKYKLLIPNDTVVIGVSGGADSVVLLDVIYKISTLYNYNLNIKVAHINHQIRDTAIRDQLFVEELCKKYNLNFYCKSVDVDTYSKKQKLSCEEAGRKIRYDFFRELAKDNGKIATAHNANDNVETVLMRFFRGTALKGLCGISYQNNNIIRPILNITRKDIEQYIADCHLSHITDETNLLPIYTRNKIRLNIMPIIEHDFNPNFCDTVNNSIRTFNQDMDFISEHTKKSYAEVCNTHNEVISIDVQKFKELHISIQNRVIIMAIEHLKGSATNISSININDIISLFDKTNNKSVNIVENIIAIRRYETVDIKFKQKETKGTVIKEIVVANHIGDIVEINGEFVKISVVEKNYVTNDELRIYVPFEKINNLVFRKRRSGDYYKKQKNMKCLLKKHLSNIKMDTEKRNNMLFLYDEDYAIWIMNYSAMRLENCCGKFVEFSII